MKKITDDFIDQNHKSLWAQMAEKHGSVYKVPKEEQAYVGELTRGLHVLQVWQREGQSKTPLSFLAGYSVMQDVAEELVATYIGQKAVEQGKQKPEKRRDKWGSFMEWAKTQDGKEFTTEQLVEKSGFSYQTTLNFVNETPEFIKVKRGLYRVSVAKRPN